MAPTCLWPGTTALRPSAELPPPVRPLPLSLLLCPGFPAPSSVAGSVLCDVLHDVLYDVFLDTVSLLLKHTRTETESKTQARTHPHAHAQTDRERERGEREREGEYMHAA